MDWRDEGTLLTVRAHGETSAIIEVFTCAHGRHAGVVRGGVSRRLTPVLQPGAELDVTWRARLADHIGTFTVEPLRARVALLSDRLALAALNSVAGLLAFALPEREPHPRLFTATGALLDRLLEPADWAADYARWEAMLLEELGHGLDLAACAVTGSRDDLAYVSPRSGRAVSRAAAGPWAERLLTNAPVLARDGPAGPADIAAALALTGHFLEHHLAAGLGDRALPAARARLVEALARRA